MKKYFITFGAGGDNYIDAGKRLIKQAEDIDLFDKNILFTDKELIIDNTFWNKHYQFIEKNNRGYGYWLWKSYIILKTMNEMKNGDILLYLDCGCEIMKDKKNLIIEYFNYIKEDKIIANEIETLEGQFSKMDLINYLQLKNDNIINSYQREAGAIMFYINDEIRQFVKEWYDISSKYHLIDDSPSKLQNVNNFIEHRHDQSIFSLLTKKYNIFSKKKISNIINYSRNRTGYSYNNILSIIKSVISQTYNISKKNTNKIFEHIFILGLIIFIIYKCKKYEN
jgi:hypothetical protein